MSQSQEEYGQIEYLLKPQEAADMLRITVATLRKWGDEGKIDFSMTVGNQRRYSRAEVERALRNGTTDDGDFYTTGQVAAIYRVAPDRVWLWANQGKLPCEFTPGGMRRFRKDVVHKIIEDSARREG